MDQEELTPSASADYFRSLGIGGCTDGVEIGVGGFGTVYRAYQPSHDRAVAVKVLSGYADERSQERFARECRALGGLSGHPNIVVLHDSGTTTTGRPYIVMEYLTRGTYADLVARQGPMEWRDVLTAGVKIAGAVETAHRRGVLHRDIKPENILVSDYGEPKLADFGIARVTGAATSRSQHITASVAHAPPEVLEGRSAAPESDVYSLASSMYFLLTGNAAFVRDTDESFWACIARTFNEPPPDLRTHGVPERVASVLERAMAKDPAERFRTAEAFAEAMIEAARELGHGPLALAVSSRARNEVELVTAKTTDSAETPVVVPEDIAAEPVAAKTPTVTAPPPAAEPVAAEPLAAATPGLAAWPTVRAADATAPVQSHLTPNAATNSLTPHVPPSLAASSLAASPAATPASDGPPHDARTADTERVSRGGRRLQLLVALVVAVIVGAAAVVVLGGGGGEAAAEIPQLRGDDAETAEQALEAAGFEVRIRTLADPDVREGRVIGSTPPAGSTLEEGREVTLLVSSGTELVEVPDDLVGMDADEAKGRLRAVGLGAVFEPVVDESQPVGTVLGLAPGTPQELEAGETVTLLLASAPDSVLVPDGLVGLAAGEATARLEAAGLTAVTRSEPSETVPPFAVIAAAPSSGSPVPPGSTVELVVSSGPAQPGTPTTESRPPSTSPRPPATPVPTQPPPTQPPPTQPPPTQPPTTTTTTTAPCTTERPDEC